MPFMHVLRVSFFTSWSLHGPFLPLFLFLMLVMKSQLASESQYASSKSFKIIASPFQIVGKGGICSTIIQKLPWDLFSSANFFYTFFRFFFVIIIFGVGELVKKSNTIF